MRSTQKLGYIVVGTMIAVAGVLPFVGCGEDDITSVDLSEEWIGAWQYMYVDRDGLIVPVQDWQNETQTKVNRKILFTRKALGNCPMMMKRAPTLFLETDFILGVRPAVGFETAIYSS